MWIVQLFALHLLLVGREAVEARPQADQGFEYLRRAPFLVLAEEVEAPVLDSPGLMKRAPGSEFLGKRSPGSEFLGKRSVYPSHTKRALGSEFLGKRKRSSKTSPRMMDLLAAADIEGWRGDWEDSQLAHYFARHPEYLELVN